MQKWLLQSQDFIVFLLGGLFGFGINLISGKLADLSIGWGIASSLAGLLTFITYKLWVGSKDEFDFYIRHGKWEKKNFNSLETWICEDTDEYQLILGDAVNNGFKEEWTRNFPDNENNSSHKLFLKRNGVIVREFIWVYCDGGRIWMPLPEIGNLGDSNNFECKREFFFFKDSLKYRMLEKIGDPGRNNEFGDLFKKTNIIIK